MLALEQEDCARVGISSFPIPAFSSRRRSPQGWGWGWGWGAVIASASPPKNTWFRETTTVHTIATNRCKRRRRGLLVHFWALATFCAMLPSAQSGDYDLGTVTPPSGRRYPSVLRGSSHANVNEFADSTQSVPPEQLHLALADPQGARDAYAMSVSWLTWVDAKSEVSWGRELDDLGQQAVGNSTRYTTHHTNVNQTEYTSGWLHSAVMGDLEPSTTYYYQVGDTDVGLSTVRNFTTPGVVGAEQPLVLGILGDLGQTNDSRKTLHAVLRHQPAVDVVLHAGDLSYADCVQERWDSFMRILDPVASHIPWMVAAGNHEIEAGSTKGGPFAAYEHRFSMPSVAPALIGLECGAGGGLDGNETACGPGLNDLLAVDAAGASAAGSDASALGFDGDRFGEAALRAKQANVPSGDGVVSSDWPETGSSGEGGEGGEGSVAEGDDAQPKCCPSEWSGTYDYGNSFYSFDVASVHVVVLNPYTATGEGSLQHTWLVEDLEACDRSLTPWLVAMFHCPWHNSNLSHANERMALTAMRAMEPVLFKHNASLTVAGHVHAYERSLPVLSGEPTGGGIVNVVVGASGNNEGSDPDYYRLPDWSAFRNGSVFGFGTLSVMNSTMALWEWKSNDENPSVHDSTWISNKYSTDLH